MFLGKSLLNYSIMHYTVNTLHDLKWRVMIMGRRGHKRMVVNEGGGVVKEEYRPNTKHVKIFSCLIISCFFTKVIKYT